MAEEGGPRGRQGGGRKGRKPRLGGNPALGAPERDGNTPPRDLNMRLIWDTPNVLVGIPRGDQKITQTQSTTWTQKVGKL